MIAALSGFDRTDAVGLLARAAIAFENDANPAGAVRLPQEERVRRAILDEVRASLGVDAADVSKTAAERVGEAIDHELDALTDSGDQASVLRRLSEKGQLPSDLYHVNIAPTIEDIYRKKWFRERVLIDKTIRHADTEQHLVPPADGQTTNLVSLFAKYFPDKHPLRSYTMLVAGQREGLNLAVYYAWRLYSDRVNMSGATDLVDLLRRFTAEFGVDFKVKDFQGNFLVETELPEGEQMQHSIEVLPLIVTDARGRKVERSSRRISLTFLLSKHSNGGLAASLTTAVDLDRYQAALEAHGW